MRSYAPLNFWGKDPKMAFSKMAVGGNPVWSNSSETAWNLQMPFYRIDAGSLRMVYVNIDHPLSPFKLRTIPYDRYGA